LISASQSEQRATIGSVVVVVLAVAI